MVADGSSSPFLSRHSWRSCSCLSCSRCRERCDGGRWSPGSPSYAPRKRKPQARSIRVGRTCGHDRPPDLRLRVVARVAMAVAIDVCRDRAATVSDAVTIVTRSIVIHVHLPKDRNSPTIQRPRSSRSIRQANAPRWRIAALAER